MKSGALRHRVDLQHFVATVNPDTGERTKEWVTAVEAIPAEIRPLSGREFLAAASAQSQVTSQIGIRYIAGVTAAHRFKQGDVIYNIEVVLPDNKSGRESLTLMCSQGGNDG